MNKPVTRIWISAILMIASMTFLVYRLMNIQIVEAEKHRGLIGHSSFYKQVIKATRGEIVDRNGEPLAGNRMGYDVIIDRATFPSGRNNDIILALIKLFEDLDEEWTDNLPITKTAPFSYLPGRENDVSRLRKFLNVSEDTSAENVMYWLEEMYGTGIGEDGKDGKDGEPRKYTVDEARKIVGVRYEMTQRGFNYSVPYTFATDIKISSVIQIRERGYMLSGVEVIESPVRIHPDGTIAPHLIGTIGAIFPEELTALQEKGYSANDVVGKSGSEYAFEDYLRGKDGVREIFRDAGGNVTEVVETQAPVPGNTIFLTFDKNMQRKAQEALEAQIKNLQETALPGMGKEANRGAAVAVEVKTGKLLACATFPSYDLNRYYDYEYYSTLATDEELRPLYNNALLGLYAPGSCFKPVVATAGLGTGIVDAGSEVFCGRVYTLPGSPQHFTCLGFHGNINVINAMRVSCNIFFYNTGYRVGIDILDKTAKEFGLGEKTGIELSERKGHRSNPEIKMELEEIEWYPGDVLQSSIGQLHHSFTPIQLANYAATLANRGKRMKLTIVEEIRDYSLQNVIVPFEPQVADTVEQSEAAFENVIKGMVAASSSIGTAGATFGNYPVSVASKTGTPERLDQPNSTFICFAPAEDPEIAIAVVIEKGWHGYTGAPVARALFDEYFGFNKPQPVAEDETQSETEAEVQTQAEAEDANVAD